MAHVLQGDLGRSIRLRQPVLGEVLIRFRATLILTTTALLLSTVCGIALGVLSAARPRSLVDRLSTLGSIFGASMPSFWLGLVLMVCFSLWLGWLPASGMYGAHGAGGLADLLSHLALPAVTASALPSRVRPASIHRGSSAGRACLGWSAANVVHCCG